MQIEVKLDDGLIATALVQSGEIKGTLLLHSYIRFDSIQPHYTMLLLYSYIRSLCKLQFFVHHTSTLAIHLLVLPCTCHCHIIIDIVSHFSDRFYFVCPRECIFQIDWHGWSLFCPRNALYLRIPFQYCLMRVKVLSFLLRTQLRRHLLIIQLLHTKMLKVERRRRCLAVCKATAHVEKIL